jgi:hypothetical protein
MRENKEKRAQNVCTQMQEDHLWEGEKHGGGVS